MALRAGGLELDGHVHLRTLERVLERQVDRRLDVRAALAALALLRAAPLAPAEHAAEDVGEVAEIEIAREVEVEVARAGSTAAAGAVRAEGVVLLPLVGVLEHVVGGLHFLEARLRLGVARVLVRMVLAGELPVRLLDLVLRGALLDAEDVVERLRHRAPPSGTPPPPGRAAARGRRGCSPSGSPRSPSPRAPRRTGRAAPRARSGRTRPQPRSRRVLPSRGWRRAGGGPGSRPPRAVPPRAARRPRARARDRRAPAGAP